MKAEGPSPYALGQLEANLTKAMEEAVRLLQTNSVAVLCRKPLLDEDLPEVSDVDLLSIWERPDECPERTTVMSSSGRRIFVDILRIPSSAMFDPIQAAGYRMLPHLILESDIVWMRSNSVRRLIDQVRLSAYERGPWELRVGSQIGFGDAALREASKNLDFPPASLFYLQMAHAYYMTALADCLQSSVTSLLTRPMTKLRKMAAKTGCGLEEQLITNLHLGTEPSTSLAALRRIYNAVSAKCGTQRLQGVNARTRAHYAYSISQLELEYREAVAEALVRRGDRANANIYLRFWAYALSRCPIVREEARHGRNPSFYVPYEPLKKSLLSTCPEIVDDLALIFGGDVTKAEAEQSIRGSATFRRSVTSQIEGRGLRPTPSKEWPAGD